ncbi:MAG TPA: hypothetical protein VKE22_16285, partial [Haliangiales bacterium]|nr:hypothetical protein [Haliangiales bacterium]
GGGGGTCAHGLCTTGAKLTSGCDPCVTQICARDAYCCQSAWDNICVSEVSTICGLNVCGTCAHPKCSTGARLSPSCDPCVATICSLDSYCCSVAWDSICVAEVSVICGETCP